jgi:hypothetical protein
LAKFCQKQKQDTRLYKNGMPAGGKLSVFKKPSKILHSIRRSLDTLEKSEEVFTLHTFEENLRSSLIQLFLLIWWNLMSSLLFSTSVCEVVRPGSFTLLSLWFLFLTIKKVALPREALS